MQIQGTLNFPVQTTDHTLLERFIHFFSVLSLEWEWERGAVCLAHHYITSAKDGAASSINQSFKSFA